MADLPDIVILMTDEERAVWPYANRQPPQADSAGVVRRVLGRLGI